MDTEFINVYLQKQKALIGELQSKVLLAESQIEILNQTVAKISNERDQLQSQIDKAAKKQTKSTGQSTDTF
jgi:peptidoglycan hydrolase CwlO-like protein